ncbi:hypothetical protein ACFX2G_002928 [Malus domestica]
MKISSRLTYPEAPGKACDTPKTNSGNSQAILSYYDENVSCGDPKEKSTYPLVTCELCWSLNTNAQSMHEGRKNGDHN